MLTEEQIIDEFKQAGALLEGHFILSSGLRSGVYLQCAQVLKSAKRAEKLCAQLADKVRSAFPEGFDLVVSPAMGGVVVGYEMGRQLETEAVFTERENGSFTFRRGFSVPEGARVLMVEDVVTTGLSSRECIAAINAAGGKVTGAACLVDRSAGKSNIGVELISLLSLYAPLYESQNLPPELAAIPAVKPGSRGLNQAKSA